MIAAQAGSKAATEKMLIANESKVNEAVAKHDVKAFNDLVAADAVSADGNGFMKVADFLKTIDQLKIGSFHVMDEKVTWVNDKTAVVTYTLDGERHLYESAGAGHGLLVDRLDGAQRQVGCRLPPGKRRDAACSSEKKWQAAEEQKDDKRRFSVPGA